MRWIIMLIMGILLLSPEPAYAGAAKEVFKIGGVGFAIVQLLILNSFTAILSFVLSAINQSQAASMVKLLGVIASITIIVVQLWGLIALIAEKFSVEL